ncbi:hypothetical protein V5F31_12165 [Xanthobacter sp. V7C-4]|uniref:hypothetical protein n=1 Tax=Xanthobacter autotrophicus (strain ATCC BAA-1158 / Py2) TaxID=78245 RepID=UPI00372A267D
MIVGELDKNRKTTVDGGRNSRAKQIKRVETSFGSGLTISVTLIELDYQSHKFSCEMIISNDTGSNVKIGNIIPRVSNSIVLEETVESSRARLIRRHEDICRETELLINQVIMYKYRSNDRKFLKYIVEESGVKRSAMALLNPINLAKLYAGLYVAALAKIVNDIKDRIFKVKINSSVDVKFTLDTFQFFESSRPQILKSKYNMKYLSDLEEQIASFGDDDKHIDIYNGQSHKSIFIMKGIPSRINTTPSSVSFEIPIQIGDESIRYVEYININVPPGAFWTSVIAMTSGIIGSYIQAVGSKLQNGIEIDIYSMKMSTFINFIPTHGVVPALTALIVYNIYDMTELRDRFNSRRGWRTAMLIGFVCGYLNLKVLAALRALIS